MPPTLGPVLTPTPTNAALHSTVCTIGQAGSQPQPHRRDPGHLLSPFESLELLSRAAGWVGTLVPRASAPRASYQAHSAPRCGQGLTAASSCWAPRTPPITLGPA